MLHKKKLKEAIKGDENLPENANRERRRRQREREKGTFEVGGRKETTKDKQRQ